MGPWHWPWPLKVGEKVTWRLCGTAALGHLTYQNPSGRGLRDARPECPGEHNTTKESPEVACVGCVGLGWSITNSHAAEIKPIAPKVAENDHFPC